MLTGLTRRLSLLGLLVVWAAQADAVVPHEATYKASVGLIPAWVEVSLRPDEGGLLTYRSEIRGRGWATLKTGRIVETSQVRVDDRGLYPVHYEKRDGFSSKDRDIVIRFDSDRSAISVYRGEELIAQGDRRPVDLLTLRLVLSSDIARDRLASEYDVVDGKGRLKTIRVADTGTETLETNVGRLNTRRLEYTSTKDRRFVIWFAPTLDFQMVRLEQYEDDRLRGRLALHTFMSDPSPP